MLCGLLESQTPEQHDPMKFTGILEIPNEPENTEDFPISFFPVIFFPCCSDLPVFILLVLTFWIAPIWVAVGVTRHLTSSNARDEIGSHPPSSQALNEKQTMRSARQAHSPTPLTIPIPHPPILDKRKSVWKMKDKEGQGMQNCKNVNSSSDLEPWTAGEYCWNKSFPKNEPRNLLSAFLNVFE